MRAELATVGHARVDGVARAADLDLCRTALAPPGSAGLRNALTVPELRAFVASLRLRELLDGFVSDGARIVRALVFDKSRGANWKVPWHQDVFVALQARAHVDGFSAWTTKNGVPHARAPRTILEGMLAVRIHVDDCGADNGPLRVLPGTHDGGVLDDETIAKHARDIAPRELIAPAGTAIVMRPLLLHASSAAASPARRRVLHLEIADVALPAPLAWHHAWPLDLDGG